MVRAPMCKICDSAHGPGEPHRWTGVAPKAQPVAVPAARRMRDAEPVERRPAPTPIPATEILVAENRALKARVAELEADAAATIRRRESQRELMKQRRAKDGGKKR